MGNVLTRDQIRAVNDIQIEPVEVPAWGGVVYVRTLSVRERERLEDPMVNAARNNGGRTVSMVGYRARVVVAAAVNEDGTQMFDAGDAEWLGEKSAAAVEVIAEKALTMSGMTDSAVQDAAGNSDGGPGGASFTGSPSGSGSPWPQSES